MADKPTIHLMCGLVGAGKTTIARVLARDLLAVCLSRDEWMLRLTGDRYDDPSYVELLGPCTELMWDVALRFVEVGTNVVLDWNFWSRDRRSEATARANAAGVNLVLHWVDVPVEEAMTRARRRLEDRRPDAHAIDDEGVRHSASIFEPPDANEGITIERHS